MAGWPVPGCEVRVVDLHMNDVPRDMQSIGEVVIRGDNVMDGYYKEPQATAAVMTEGWLHTGDMAVWDEENYIHIVDRKKDIIISGGENISSIEVERAIFAHPAVLECAVVSAPDPQWGEVPAAFVVLKPGTPAGRAELCAFLDGRIARFKMPRRFEFRERPAAQDRDRQNRQAPAARSVLGRQGTARPRIINVCGSQLHAHRRQPAALRAGGRFHFVLLVLLGVLRKPAWMASLVGLGAAVAGGAGVVYGMPLAETAGAVTYGAAFGLFPIGWVVFAAILLYRVVLESGKFEVLKDSIGHLTDDPRCRRC